MQLNEQQRQAVDSDSRAILVLADPGSGKTEVLIRRIVRLIRERGVSPAEILCITFTRKAAQNMLQRLKSALPDVKIWKMFIGTSHSFCCRVIREFGEVLGYDRDFVIYDEMDREDIVTGIVKGFGYKTKPKKVIEAFSSGDPLDGEIASIRAEYEARLKQWNALDYDMILTVAVRIIQEHPEALRHYQNQYRYLFYDEGQDIADLEYQLCLTMAVENWFMVGDFNQEIYRFRGTSNEYLLRIQERSPDCEVIKLHLNYRSGERICRAATSLINRNPQPFGKYEVISARFIASSAKGCIELLVREDEEAEAQAVARWISRKMLAGDGFSFRETAVLARTNGQLPAIARALEVEGIPSQVIARDLYYRREEIRSILAILRVVVNPKDDYSMGRILRMPHLKVGSLKRQEIRHFALTRGICLYEACSAFAQDHAGEANLGALVAEVEALRRLAAESRASETFKHLVEEGAAGYLADLLERGLSTKAESLIEFGTRIIEFEIENAGDDVSLNAFLEGISLEAAIDRWDEDRNAVTVSTIHCAKGLEWERVIVAGCEEGFTPHLKSKDESSVEEERRLFFVAVTRAKDELVLSLARKRALWNQYLMREPSRFIAEMGVRYGADHG